jgi:predicted metallopeptidase
MKSSLSYFSLGYIIEIKSKEKIKKLAEEKKKISVNPITHPKTFSEILSALEDVSSLVSFKYL